MMKKSACYTPSYKRFNSVDELPEMCTPEDLSNFFAVTPATICNWQSGKNCTYPLAYFQCSRSVRFRKEDVKEFIRKNMKGITAEVT